MVKRISFRLGIARSLMRPFTFAGQFAEIFAIFWRIVGPFHNRFISFFGLIVIYQLVAIADAYIITFSIEQFDTTKEMWHLLLLIGGVYLFDELFNRYDNWIDWIIVTGILYPIYAYVKGVTFDRFLAMDLSWHHKQRSGALLIRAQKGVEKLDRMANDISWELVPTLVQFVVSLIPLAMYSVPSALMLMIALPAFLVLAVKKHRAQKGLRKIRHDHYDTAGATESEGVDHISTVQIYGQQAHFKALHQDSLSGIIDCGHQEAQLGIYRYGRWQNRITMWVKRAVMFMLVYQVTLGTITVAEVLFVWALTEKLVHAFWRFGRLYDNAADASESIDRISKIAELTPAIKSPPSPKLVPEGAVTILFNNVSFSYNGGGEDAITDVSVEFKAGKTYALVGPSGAGKSTLINLAARLLDVNLGSVMINGVDVRHIDLELLRAYFAVVEQNPPIVNRTIEENIRMGLSGPMEDVIQAARDADLHEFVLSTQDGYQTIVGERGIRLSGGQKQRLAIARALFANRPVLILDEPTASLDAGTERRIQHALRRYFTDPQKTVIIIAHRLSTIRDVDEIIVLKEGSIVEQGTHQELLKIPEGVYAQMWSDQIGSLV